MADIKSLPIPRTTEETYLRAILEELQAMRAERSARPPDPKLVQEVIDPKVENYSLPDPPHMFQAGLVHSAENKPKRGKK